MTAARQLLLNIRPEEAPSFANYVVGANAELLTRLGLQASPGAVGQIYLWGPPGSGRSHLLGALQTAALAAVRPVLSISGEDVGDDLTAPAGALLIVDNVDRLSELAQIALFRVFNAARLQGLALALSGPEPPRGLTLREDLRTRIGATLVYEVKPLSDSDKAQALGSHARARGMPIDPAVIDYLLRHGRRDLPTLLAAIDLLDRVSLEQQRLPSLPLLRELMQKSLELSDETPSAV